MDAKQIQTIARHAVKSTREHHGRRVWDYVNAETRKGWVARTGVVEFAMASPGSPASDVAKVVAATDEIINGE